MAIYLAGKAYIHCLATDSHDSKNRNAIQVQQTAKTIEELIGPRNLQLISRENPIRGCCETRALKSMDSQGVQVTVKKSGSGGFGHREDQRSSLKAESDPQITEIIRRLRRFTQIII